MHRDNLGVAGFDGNSGYKRRAPRRSVTDLAAGGIVTVVNINDLLMRSIALLAADPALRLCQRAAAATCCGINPVLGLAVDHRICAHSVDITAARRQNIRPAAFACCSDRNITAPCKRPLQLISCCAFFRVPAGRDHAGPAVDSHIQIPYVAKQRHPLGFWRECAVPILFLHRPVCSDFVVIPRSCRNRAVCAGF